MQPNNTNTYGNPWSLETRIAVWQKTKKIEGTNPNFVRLDAYGAVIEWKMFGKNSPNGTGWYIEHIVPISQGGTDSINNLHAVQWIPTESDEIEKVQEITRF
ncbi:HNH endonuclease [Zhouia amylolytica]|uniref:HNH endonuclease n=1 Tax=Zhouia amylolytica TaxID=376730 RepID=UPI0020CC5B38|nr:HNH endonuclease [Zhouia amylolytica]MCQ0112000.1 HNH endonuclease [Zhouia amylolytica]